MNAVLLDLDGVVYRGDVAVPGAKETIEWFREQGVPCLFLTNTTSRPRAALVEKLAGMGIAVAEEQIFTPPVAAVQWLRTRVSNPMALFVPPATRRDFAALPSLPEQAECGAGAVVLGDLGTGWDFATLNRAFRLLMADPDTLLVALGMTRYWRAPDGLRLDVAPFVMALAHATGREPHVLGKPARPFFGSALQCLRATAGGAVMVGDDIRGDVDGAHKAGLRAVLTRTGKFRAEDLSGPIKPDGVIDSIADLPSWWRKHVAADKPRR